MRVGLRLAASGRIEAAEQVQQTSNWSQQQGPNGAWLMASVIPGQNQGQVQNPPEDRETSGDDGNGYSGG